MIPLFLGLTLANLIILCLVAGQGFASVGSTGEAGITHVHVVLGVASGFMSVMTHVVVYMYHMATSRWLRAATHKLVIGDDRFVDPAFARKRKVMIFVMPTILLSMVNLFVGAAADAGSNTGSMGQVHTVLAMVTIAVNFAAAVGEFACIRGQGRLMDDALAELNRPDLNQPELHRPDESQPKVNHEAANGTSVQAETLSAGNDMQTQNG